MSAAEDGDHGHRLHDDNRMNTVSNKYSISVRLPFMILLAVLSSACSNTQEKLDQQQQMLDACRQEQNQSQADWQKKSGQLEKHLEECQLQAREIISDAGAAQERETELRQLLHRELKDKSVELEYLRGRLTVRLMDRILFESGSARILASGKEVLDRLAASITRTQDLIRVVGHTDDVKISKQLQRKYPSNWELSAARASSVVRYFQQQHGIDPLRMEAVGLSRYRPITSNTDEAGRQRNRRVEVILTARDHE